MKFADQLARRRDQLQRTNASLVALTGFVASHLSPIFRGKKDSQGSTLEALADALDAEWVLVPKHLLPEVNRLLSGKAIGPDDVPSALERVLNLPASATIKAQSHTYVYPAGAGSADAALAVAETASNNTPVVAPKDKKNGE